MDLGDAVGVFADTGPCRVAFIAVNAAVIAKNLAAVIGLVHAREKVAHTRAQSHHPVALPKLSQVAPLGTDLVLVDVDLARDDAELTKRILKAGH